MQFGIALGQAMAEAAEPDQHLGSVTPFSSFANVRAEGPHRQSAAGLRVLLLAGRLGNGGATSYIATKASWLHRAGAEVMVISAGGPGMDRLVGPGIQHRIVGALARPAMTARRSCRNEAVATLVRAAAEFAPTIIEAAWPSSAEYGDLLSAEVDVPLMVHELYYHLNRVRYVGLVRKWVTNGQLVMGFCDARRSIALATGVDTSACPVLRIPIELPRIPLTATPATPGEHVRVSTVARLDYSKRYLEHLITQVAEIKWEGPVTLRLVGDGDDRARLERIAARVSVISRRFEFVGLNFDIHESLSGTHIFVGQGTAAVQAAGLGLPVVLSGVNSEPTMSPGIFGEDESLSIGDPFPGQVPASYRDRIEGLLNNQGTWYAAVAHSRTAAWEHFNVENVMSTQLRLYGELVGRWQAGACQKGKVAQHLSFRELATRRAWGILPPRIKGVLASKR